MKLTPRHTRAYYLNLSKEYKSALTSCWGKSVKDKSIRLLLVHHNLSLFTKSIKGIKMIVQALLKFCK
jgi:hypothetical protein